MAQSLEPFETLCQHYPLVPTQGPAAALAALPSQPGLLRQWLLGLRVTASSRAVLQRGGSAQLGRQQGLLHVQLQARCGKIELFAEAQRGLLRPKELSQG